MSCGCNRKRVKHNTVNHSDILRKLKKGVVKVITKNNLLLCTHYDESLPSKNSKNYRDINNQHKNKIRNPNFKQRFNKSPRMGKVNKLIKNRN